MRRLILFVALFALWLLLVWSVDSQDLLAGLFLAVLVAVVFGGVFLSEPKQIIAPKRWFLFLCYVPYFLYWCVRANLDVAYRVLHPDLPIRPGIVKVRTNLKSNLGKTFLANSITLTPGTLTVDIIGSDIYVHWINVSTDDPEEQTRTIVQRFEGLLKRIFE